MLCALLLTTSALPSASALVGESIRSADTLATLGIVRGVSSSDYALNDLATRAQAAVLLVRLAGCEQKAAADPWYAGFRDLPAWAADSIDYAVHQEWITRGAQLDFFPSAPATAADVCTALLRLLGYSDPQDFDPAQANVFAHRIGLISQPAEGPLHRADLFAILRDALVFPAKDSGKTPAEQLVANGTVPRATASALGLLDAPLTARQIADRHSAASVLLNCYGTQEEIDKKEPSSSASAFLVSPDGLALTNFHSIEGAIYAEGQLVTGEAYPVERVIWYDADMDLAIIRLSKRSTALKRTSSFASLEVVGTTDLRVGDQVYAMGNPLGLGLSVTEGIVSAVGHHVERYALPCIVSTADISRGSSGGALLNAYGQVVSITSGAYSYGNSMYLSVPADPFFDADLSAEGITLSELKALDIHSK